MIPFVDKESRLGEREKERELDNPVSRQEEESAAIWLMCLSVCVM